MSRRFRGFSSLFMIGVCGFKDFSIGCVCRLHAQTVYYKGEGAERRERGRERGRKRGREGKKRWMIEAFPL